MWKFTNREREKTKQNKHHLDGCWCDDKWENLQLDIHIKIDYVWFFLSLFEYGLKWQMKKEKKEKYEEKKKHANISNFWLFIALFCQSEWVFCFYFYDDAEIIQILRTVHVRFLACVSMPFVLICHSPLKIALEYDVGFWRISTLAKVTANITKKKIWLKLRKSIVRVWVTKQT